MRTINELITEVRNGNMTVEEAAVEVHPYAARYYEPSDGEWDTYQAIRQEFERRQAPPKAVTSPDVPMRRCSCGHTIPENLVMSASMGTSCPDCYDKMSD